MPIIGGSSGAVGPGTEIGYDQITASVNITGLAEGSATTAITCAAHTFDGTACYAEFYCVVLLPPNSAAGDTITAALFESGTLINRFTQAECNVTGATTFMGGTWKFRFTPTAVAHTYTVGAWVTSTTGVPKVIAGVGGPGVNPPAFVRFVKA